MGISNSKKALLHIAKKDLCLSEDEYRGALLAYGKAESSKNLDIKGFREVMKHFERCGFKSKSKQSTACFPTHDRPGFATDAELRKIYALWWALGGSYYRHGQERKALRGFLKKRFRVDHENFLTSRQAWQVIEAIKQIGGRLKVEGGRKGAGS